ncbi:hypothetical protein RMN56_02485 [Micromonospora halotolerans]|uniref:Uncharacterized protein n=1 Tax=Micromonospora halotolerans TaxID=709879 RepID=A0ABY9ZY64_9ACTN|nr:hypothetical protein [Micromonospora halotolerans]WNM40254.1 hypothetical protein RMN56_02485 [Micromonospora halotolerans]
MLGQRPQRRCGLVCLNATQALRGQRGDRDGDGVRLIGLPVVAGGQQAHPGGELGWHVDGAYVIGCQPRHQRRTQSTSTLNRPHRTRESAGEAAQLLVAVAINLYTHHSQHPLRAVDRRRGPARLVRIDADDDLASHPYPLLVRNL